MPHQTNANISVELAVLFLVNDPGRDTLTGDWTILTRPGDGYPRALAAFEHLLSSITEDQYDALAERLHALYPPEEIVNEQKDVVGYQTLDLPRCYSGAKPRAADCAHMRNGIVPIQVFCEVLTEVLTRCRSNSVSHPTNQSAVLVVA